MNAIEINELTKKYKGFTLDKISFTLPQGCVLGLIGENGAGKSTIIKTMLGITHSDRGSIKVLGTEMNGNANQGTVKNDIGVVLDDVGFPSMMRLPQIGKVLANSYNDWNGRLFEDYLKRFDLPKNKAFGDFSKGMKIRAGLAAALSHNAKLLILDEPTSGLDPLVRDELIDLLGDYTRDESHSILISSHIVSDLEKLCDYIAFLHKGKLMLCEEKDTLLERYGLLHTSPEKLAELDQSAIMGSKITNYGAEAIVDRQLVPSNFELSQIGIEDLFIFMAKERKEAQ